MNPLDCARAEELVSARLDRALDPEEAAALSAHLAGCPACRRAAEEHENLAAELSAAFRAEPLRAARPLPAAAVRARPRRRWLALAAAAALLVGAAGTYLAVRRPPSVPAPAPLARHTEPAHLAGGTEVAPAGEAWLRFLGPQGDTDQVIQLEAGEIRVEAAKASPGRRAVRVATPLGNVETLGTVFRVKLIGRAGEGETNMKLRSVVPLVAVALLVSVDQGRVRVTGAAEAGEGIVVGASDKVIKAMVSKVEDKDGALAVTIPAGKADGVREGFEFTCKFKDWTGKVVAVTEDSAVLEVKAELKAKVAVRDMAETKLTTVLAEAKPGEKVEPAPVKVEAVEGLQLVLVKRENVFKFTAYVDKDGKPLRTERGAVKPEGAEEKIQERRTPELVAQLKNVSDKTVVLGFTLSAMGWGGANPIKLFARDADGKDVPRLDGYMPAADKSGPAAVTILKPGQVLEQQFQFLPFRFPAEGKYTVWATLEEQPRPEVLPGFTPWSGKLKSNEVEWEYKGMKGVGGPWGNPGAGGDAPIRVEMLKGGPGQPTTPNPAPVPPDKKEVF